MATKQKKPKQRGRPPRYGPELEEMAGSIQATPEELARAIMQGPPKKDWNYLKKRRAS